jgi:hypothetical protein
MPYIVTSVNVPAKWRTIYRITNEYSNEYVGNVIIHGRRRKWSFTSETGTQLSAKTSARQINGMKQAIRDYLLKPYPMPGIEAETSNAKNPWAGWGDKEESEPEAPQQKNLWGEEETRPDNPEWDFE